MFVIPITIDFGLEANHVKQKDENWKKKTEPPPQIPQTEKTKHTHTPIDIYKIGFLNFSTVDILDQIIFCFGGVVLCIVGWLVVSLASTLHSSCPLPDFNPKVHMLPNVLGGGCAYMFKHINEWHQASTGAELSASWMHLLELKGLRYEV